MAQFELPIEAIPNQLFSTTLNGETWMIELTTRLSNLYISLTSKSNGLVLSNRICLDRTSLGFGFVFVDIDGTSNPTYEQLGTRYLLIWDSTV